MTPDEAKASVTGKTTEDVLRAMAGEKGADPRIVVLVARFDLKRQRREAKATT